MRGDSQCMWGDLELPCDMYGDAINSGQAQISQRGNNNRRSTLTTPQVGVRDGASWEFDHWFENAAEYDDSIDAESPLWFEGNTVDDEAPGARGQGRYVAPQGSDP